MASKKIIIGTWPLSGDYGAIKQKDIVKILKLCEKKNFLEFDTAPSYGNYFAEKILGETLRENKRVKFNTKVGNLGSRGKSFKLKNIKVSFQESMERLHGKINILYLHNPRLPKVKILELLNYLNDLKKKGYIQKTGISLAKNFNYEIELLNKFDAVQDDANLLFMRFLNFKKKKFKFYARSPFANGLLTEKFELKRKFNVNDHRRSWLNARRKKTILKCINVIKSEVSADIKKLAFNYLFFNPMIDYCIFGVKQISHINYLAKSSSNKKPKIEFKRIEDLYSNNFNLNKKDIKYMF